MPYLGVKPADEFTSKDLNGAELILDADADTTITADTDDQIDIKIAGADDFQFTANTFTAQSGSTIAAQALTATTGVFSSDVTALNLNATGDTSAGDNAAIGYTAAEGLILAGQGSTNDITIKRDDDAAVLEVATGSGSIEISTGDLFFGTAGKGIVLGVTSNTDSNTLDDYEEGSFTATIDTATSGGFNMDTSYDTGAYTKVGRIVHVHGQTYVSSDNSPNGQVRLALPFTPATPSEYAGVGYTHGVIIANYSDGTSDTHSLGWIEASSGAYARMYEITDGTGVVQQITHTKVDTAFAVAFNFIYTAT